MHFKINRTNLQNRAFGIFHFTFYLRDGILHLCDLNEYSNQCDARVNLR